MRGCQSDELDSFVRAFENSSLALALSLPFSRADSSKGASLALILPEREGFFRDDRPHLQRTFASRLSFKLTSKNGKERGDFSRGREGKLWGQRELLSLRRALLIELGMSRWEEGPLLARLHACTPQVAHQ